jgi:hypothetical protein
LNRYRAPVRNGNGAASNPMQGSLPLANPNGEFMNRLERRCTEDPEFLRRLADAVRDIGTEQAEQPADQPAQQAQAEPLDPVRDGTN